MANVSGIQGNYDGKKYIHTENGDIYKKPGMAATTGAVLAANMAGGLAMRPIQNAFRKPFLGALKEMERLNYTQQYSPIFDKFVSNELSKTGKEFIEASKKAFGMSGLAQKYGTEFVNVKNISDVKDIDKAIPKWIKKFPKLEKIVIKKLESAKTAIAEGKNACFVPNTNKIYVNTDKMSYASFHEMGHALNKHASKIGKILQKSRQPGMLLAVAAMFTAIFKRKKAEGEQPTGVVDKVTTFIKDNCGKLAFLGTLPTILEEGLASVKGAKLAKEVLSPKNYKLLNKFNGAAWLSYLGMGVGITAATVLASKVRDSIAKPEKVAQEVKPEQDEPKEEKTYKVPVENLLKTIEV